MTVSIFITYLKLSRGFFEIGFNFKFFIILHTGVTQAFASEFSQSVNFVWLEGFLKKCLFIAYEQKQIFGAFFIRKLNICRMRTNKLWENLLFSSFEREKQDC